MNSNWKSIKLGEISEFRNGVNFDNSSFGKGIKVINVADFKERMYPDYETLGELSSEVKWPDECFLKNGDIIFVRSNGNKALIGRSIFIKDLPTNYKVIYSAFCIRLRFKNNIRIDYLYYLYVFKSPLFRSLLSQFGNGTNINNLNQDILNNIKVPTPPLTIQKKIASILSAYDDLIENNNKRIKLLEEMAEEIYKEWFIRFRFPGYKETKFFDSDGKEVPFETEGALPEGWEKKQVEDIIERYQSGKKYDNKTALTKGIIPILDQGQSGLIGYHNDEPGIVATLDDPIIVFANHTCYQNLIQYSFSTIQNVLPFKSKKELDLNIYWLHYATNNLIVFNDYKGHWPEFIAKKIVIPQKDISELFGNIIKPIANEQHILCNKNKIIQETRDLLLPRLISGKLDIKKLDIDSI